MAPSSSLLKACLRIEQEIEKTTNAGKGSHKTRTALRRDLALWLTTWWPVRDYPRLSMLNLPWKKWDSELGLPTLRAAAAVHLLATEKKRKNTLEWARKWTGMTSQDFAYVFKLLEEVGLSARDVEQLQAPRVAADVAASRERIHVRFEARALEDMLLAAAEGYEVSPRKNLKYTEVFGVCFGSVRHVAANRDNVDLHINVSRVATQMRARATENEVNPNWDSMASHLAVAKRFFPHLEIVGDYHTHPYDTFAELVREKGWIHSEADELSIDPFVDKALAHQSRPRFSLVVAVASGGKSGGAPRRRRANLIQVPIADLFFVISAYRIRLDATYDDAVTLQLPAMIR